MEREIISKTPVESKLEIEWNEESQNVSNNCSSSHEACSETMLFMADSDDPPPYESLVPTNGLPWSHVLSSGVQCCDSRTHFQPLALYTMFKLNTCRLIRSSSTSVYSEDSAKVNAGTARKYGVICISCIVVISLMVLSLLVRCLIDKSFWRD